MIQFGLVLHRTTAGPVLGPSRWIRLVFLCSALAAFGSMVLLVQWNFPILGVGIVCLIGAAYEESWRYSTELGLFERRYGLIIAYRRDLLALDRIAAIELIKSPDSHTQSITLSLVLVDQSARLIDHQSGRQSTQLCRVADTFSQLSGKPIVTVTR